MEANELRLGNWIEKSLKSGNGRKLFNKLTITDLNHIIEKDGSFNYNPIPLTEEILLKCGFKKVKGYKYILSYSKFSVVKIDNITTNDYAFSHYFVWVKINYLHQLQNLYFALTGTELEIKL